MGRTSLILEISTYKFENLTVKYFYEKYVSTSIHSKFQKVNGIKISNYQPVRPQIEVANITGLRIIEECICSVCNYVLTVNKALTTVKCTNCKQRKLTKFRLVIQKCQVKTDDDKILHNP